LSDETKTREQLLAEIESLKRELEQRDAGSSKDAEKSASPAQTAPVFATPVTRRESLTAWVAPVILALPVVQGLGMALKPGRAQAQGMTVAPTPGAVISDDDATTDDGAPAPTMATASPTPVPAPTMGTMAPTMATAAPTMGSAAPTRAGRCIPAPTSAPVASPTLGAGAAPDSRPCPPGFVALGGARAMARQLGC
jgi:hypothetical protein